MSAGIDKALSFVDLRRVPWRVTRAGGDSFGPHMAEYVLGSMIAHERHLYQWNAAQRGGSMEAQ